MNRTNLTPGVTFLKDGTASIMLWAPKAETAVIVLNDNERLPLNKVEKGYWKLATNTIRPLDTYKFLLNGTKELPDPASRSQPDGVHGPSQAIDLQSYQWRTTNGKLRH
jgi:maltooligosyltrehalose trehalohydrolase